MSRAFVKEADDAEPLRRPEPELPPGVPNHVTRAGERRFRERHAALRAERRALGDSGLDAARRAQVDADLAWLERRLATMVVTEPPPEPTRVAFGTRVVAVRADGTERVFHVVGVDEVDPARGHVGFLSPLGRAFVGAAVGDEVRVPTPRGEEQWEILEISADTDGLE